MFIAFLTLLSALSISGVAIFYSVLGLAAIFPGAFVPIIVMGGVLEVGKLVTASWLYRNWKFTPWLLKSYLTLAIVILSLITSMGIFGFLSKAHVEQNLTSETVIARIQIINDKIESEKVYIARQKTIIERADNSLVRVGGSNNDDIDIEKDNIKNANDKLATLLAIESSAIKEATENQKTLLAIESSSITELTENLKTLLAVETNTIKDLNTRLSILDGDVNALRDKKGLFSGGNHKKAMKLKEAQAQERNKINIAIKQAQGNIKKLKENHQANIDNINASIKNIKENHQTNISDINKRIAKLKKEHADEIAKAQANIEEMRGDVSTNKDDIETSIVTAETNIFNSQNNIDSLIVERQPLEAEILKLETEVGPVKYIAALAVDWGMADEVNLSKAVRWVIIIIIFVFDPLAVLLLIAANQSLIRRYPPERPAPPQEILDLEKPDHDLTFDPPVKKTTPEEKQWNSMISEAATQLQKEQLEKATSRLKDWKDKLEKFNSKVPKPDDKPIEIVTDKSIENDDKKKEFKKRVEEEATQTKEEDLILERPETVSAILPEIKEPKEITKFKPVEEVLNAKPRVIKTMDKPGVPKEISEQIEEVMEPERTRPDFTEVIKPDVKPAFESQPTLPTKEERDKILKEFHTKHGDYDDISEDELKKERDETNKAQFLADVGLTEEDAKNHPPMTSSRKAFFQDHVDDVLRGNTTFENLPPDIAKTVAVLLSDYDDPQIILPGSALKEEEGADLPKMTTEQLAEKFAAEPNTEDRDISEDELDKLLEGFDDTKAEDDGKKYKLVIQHGQKVRVPVEEDEYVQNEEQQQSGNWSKILDIKEPEKNEIVLPEMENTDDFQDRTDEELVDVQPENTISPAKIDRHKKRMISDVDYREKIEERINALISKIETKELTLDDLTENDRQVIIDIMNQNG